MLKLLPSHPPMATDLSHFFVIHLTKGTNEIAESTDTHLPQFREWKINRDTDSAMFYHVRRECCSIKKRDEINERNLNIHLACANNEGVSRSDWALSEALVLTAVIPRLAGRFSD